MYKRKFRRSYEAAELNVRVSSNSEFIFLRLPKCLIHKRKYSVKALKCYLKISETA